MERKEPKGQSAYIYDESGTEQVSEQIMDSYNSGVIESSQMAYEANADNKEDK